MRRSYNLANRFEQERMILLTAQSERERKITGADELYVDTWRGRNRSEIFDCRGVFYVRHHRNVFVGEIVIASRSGPAERR